MTTADDRRKAAATASTYDQGNIKGLDEAMTRRLVASTVLTESNGGDLAITNKQGYVGRYQGGASWLVEAGYVNRDKFDAAFKESGHRSEWAWAVSGGMTKFLERDSNWNNGLDLDKYKASGDLQDKAFKTNSDKLYDRAARNGLLDADDSPEKVAGYLKASHLGGYGAGRDVLQGKSVRSDANGTSPYDYFNDIAKNRDGLNQFMGRSAPNQSQNTPTPSQAAGADGQLKRGEEGPEVVALQKRLNKLDYGRPNGESLIENGKFGPNTEAAVVKFQKEHGLDGLGVVGPKTMAALDAAEKIRTQPQQPQPPSDARPAPSRTAPASHAIYSEAYQHFLANGNRYEYGRGDMTRGNKEGNGRTDRSRTEQDLDGDGLKGVDCSSFVWRGLKNAGYGVGNSPFTTHALFNGNQITDYSKKNFDVIPAAEAKRLNGSMEPGDIILFKDKDSGGQHVGIFKGYDSKGNTQFIGSQVSTGPAQASAGPGSYWNGKDFEIVGALRAKPEFQVRQPINGAPEMPAGTTTRPTTAKNETAGADGQLKRGEEGPEVTRLQDRLNKLGYGRADGTPLVENGKFGPNTAAAVIKFQKEHGLEGLGMVGPKTLAALDAAEKAQSQGQGGQTTKPGMALNAAYAMSVKHDDVQYGFGSKNLASGKVDCSGWVSQLQNATMNEINQKAGKTVFSGKDFFDKNNQAAADIIKDSVQTTGTLVRSPLSKSQLKEGMIIGEDNGRMGWDKGRYNGIDHITMVVKDPKTGQLMVSQSRGGEGVELTTLGKYLERKQANGVELFATDPLSKARPLMEAQQTAPTKTADARITAPIEKQQSPLLSDASHPDHGLYRQAMKGLDQMPAGAFKNAQERENAGAAIACEAKVAGLNQIDHVKVLGNGPGMFVVQGGLDDPSHKRISVDQQQVAQQSVQKSSELAQQAQSVQTDTQPKPDNQARALA